MYYVLICKDHPNSLEKRMATRPPHVEYLKSLEAKGILKTAGPLLGDDEKPVGSMWIIQASDMKEAEALAAGDPYAKADLFASVEIRAFNWTFKNPEA